MCLLKFLKVESPFSCGKRPGLQNWRKRVRTTNSCQYRPQVLFWFQLSLISFGSISVFFVESLVHLPKNLRESSLSSLRPPIDPRQKVQSLTVFIVFLGMLWYQDPQSLRSPAESKWWPSVFPLFRFKNFVSTLTVTNLVTRLYLAFRLGSEYAHTVALDLEATLGPPSVFVGFSACGVLLIKFLVYRAGKERRGTFTCEVTFVAIHSSVLIVYRTSGVVSS